jgi:hypothetical protein
MITMTMSAVELDREIQADAPNVRRFIVSKYPKLFRLVKTRTPFRYYSIYNSVRKNKWMIVWSFTDNDYRTICSFPACLVESPSGTYACTLVLGEQARFSVYVPHFFSRYSQRAGIDKTGTELIAHYFYNNLDYTYHHHYDKTAEHSHLVEQVTREGVAFGFYFENEIGMLYRTFITQEMAKGEQVPLYKEKGIERYLENEVGKPPMTLWW